MYKLANHIDLLISKYYNINMHTKLELLELIKYKKKKSFIINSLHESFCSYIVNDRQNNYYV